MKQLLIKMWFALKVRVLFITYQLSHLTRIEWHVVSKYTYIN